MKKLLVSSALLLAISTGLFAQKAPRAKKEKTQSITITTDGNKKEKMTVVIDGDKVTVNGKPLEELKEADIKVHVDSDVMPPLPPMPPMPAFAGAMPHGGAKVFTRNFSMNSNSAFLGVASSSDENGAAISEITKNSPAEKAGLKKGDVITKVGDTKIDDADDLVEAVGKYKPEDKVAVTYKRDSKENSVTVTLDKNKTQNFNIDFDNDAFKNFSFNWHNKPRIGMRVQDLENNTGVKITDVDADKDSPAFKAGLKENDVITQINGKKVTSVKEVKDQLADVKPGDDATIVYERNSASQTVKVHLPKPLESSDL